MLGDLHSLPRFVVSLPQCDSDQRERRSWNGKNTKPKERPTGAETTRDRNTKLKMTTYEKLANTRQRIASIRETLANPTFFSEITIDGVSEKIDRKALREELAELEAEEQRLLDQINGVNPKLFGIQMRR